MSRPISRSIRDFSLPVNYFLTDEWLLLESQLTPAECFSMIKFITHVASLPECVIHGTTPEKIRASRSMGVPEELINRFISLGLETGVLIQQENGITTKDLQKSFERVMKYRQFDRERKQETQPEFSTVENTIHTTSINYLKEVKSKEVFSTMENPTRKPHIPDVDRATIEREHQTRGIEPHGDSIYDPEKVMEIIQEEYHRAGKHLGEGDTVPIVAARDVVVKNLQAANLNGSGLDSLREAVRLALKDQDYARYQFPLTFFAQDLITRKDGTRGWIWKGYDKIVIGKKDIKSVDDSKTRSLHNHTYHKQQEFTAWFSHLEPEEQTKIINEMTPRANAFIARRMKADIFSPAVQAFLMENVSIEKTC
jgi:hypothetical protein